jgi:adenylate cyclase
MNPVIKTKRFLVISLISFVLACFADLASDWENTLGLRGLFGLRGRINPPADVVIVSIDQPSADHYFPNKPIDFTQWRGKHAALVEQLHKQGVAQIVFDLFLQSPQPGVDPLLAEKFRAQHNVLIGDHCIEISNNTHCRGKVDNQSVQIITPTPVLAKAIADHGPFVLEDNGGEDVINKSLNFLDSAKTPTLPIIAWFHSPEVQGYLNKQGRLEHPVSSWIVNQHDYCKQNGTLNPPLPRDRLGERITDLLCNGNTRYLNFYGPPGTIRTESYYAVREGKVADLAGKTVFVGQNLQMRDDMFRTPTTTDDSGKMAGVEIMATHYANLLQNNFIKPVTPFGLGLMMALFALAVSLLLNQLPLLLGLTATLLFCCAYLRLAVSAFSINGWWLPVAVPFLVELPLILVLSLFWAAVDYLREVQRLKAIIEQITQENNRLIDRFIDRVKDSDKPELKLPRDGNPQTVYAVCLATDVKGYTTLSESKTSAEIAELLKTYYELIRPIVNENGGVIRSIAGDGMIATWDDPGIKDKRYAACKAALNIHQTLKEQGLFETLPTRFGLHEGEFTLLDVEDWKINAIGDAINTVSRIEGVNKELKTAILASSIVTQTASKIAFRPVGRFLLKGKIQPIELVELRPGSSIELFCYYFKRGLIAFNNGEWERAEQTFNRLCAKKAEDGPSEYYLNLCRSFKENPPLDWPGYIVLETK